MELLGSSGSVSGVGAAVSSSSGVVVEDAMMSTT
jgi:hypothetical protein